MVSLTAKQKTNHLGFPKPGELIEMTGTHALEASDRAILNLLYQQAHDSGRLLEPEAEWEVPLATLRQALSKHEGNSRLRESLKRLKAISVSVGYVDADGEPRVQIAPKAGSGSKPRRALTTSRCRALHGCMPSVPPCPPNASKRLTA